MKKAILVVSVGTTHKETMKITIDKIEEEIRENFKTHYVMRAFTSHMIINKLKNRDGIIVPTPEEALEMLYADGFEEVIVQPLHIIPGDEFQYVKLVTDKYEKMSTFKSIKVGRPVLYFQGEDGKPDDYEIFIEAIKDIIPKDKTMLFIGHGSNNIGNSAFITLEGVFRHMNMGNVYVGTVKGQPTRELIINRLKKNGISALKLAPLMLTAGEHALKDMASEEGDSWKGALEIAGIEVELYIYGLGEVEKFRKIYLNHIQDVIDSECLNLGK